MVEKKDVNVTTAISNVDTVAQISTIVGGKLNTIDKISTIVKINLIATIAQVKHHFIALQSSMRLTTATIK